MNEFNPWDVDSIEAFACLKCPECDFDTKGEDDFQNHANENHPLSCVFFGLKPKIKRLGKDRIENFVESSFIKPKIKRLKLEKSKICEDNFPLKTEFHDSEINSNEMEYDQTEIETDQIDYESVHENDSSNYLEESNVDTIEDLGKNVYDNEKEHVQTVDEAEKSEEINKEIKCSICSTSFSCKGNLKEHLVTVHDNTVAEEKKSYNCKNCGKEYDDKRELKMHTLFVHEGKKLYQCSICNAQFIAMKGTWNHLISAHGMNNLLNLKPLAVIKMNLIEVIEKSLKCKICGEKCENKKELEVHVLSVHERKTIFRCTICKYYNIEAKKLKPHIVHVHKEMDVSNYKLKDLIEMKLVLEIENSPTCDQCGDKFDDKNELKGHILLVHQGKKLYRCSICSFVTTGIASVKNHLISIHEKEDLLNSKPKEILDTNLVHEIENPPNFEQSDNKIKSDVEIIIEKYLDINPDVEFEGKKSYGCNICKTYFSSKSDLVSHIQLVHNEKMVNEKPSEFEAEVHEDQNEHNNTLDTKHAPSVHEGKKSHKCPICSKSFSEVDLMKSHIGTAHFSLW